MFIHDFKFLAEQGEADNPDSTDFPSMLHGLLRISGGGEVDVMSSNMHKSARLISHITLSMYFSV